MIFEAGDFKLIASSIPSIGAILWSIHNAVNRLNSAANRRNDHEWSENERRHKRTIEEIGVTEIQMKAIQNGVGNVGVTQLKMNDVLRSQSEATAASEARMIRLIEELRSEIRSKTKELGEGAIRVEGHK
jgi:hypothetical protein